MESPHNGHKQKLEREQHFWRAFSILGGWNVLLAREVLQLKKTMLKTRDRNTFFDNRLKRERCRKNKKAVKSLQCERLNRGEGSVAAVSCAFFGPNLWPEWSFFRTRARFLTQKHENVNIKRDQAPLARKRRCGRYGVKRFSFLQPL